MKDFRSIPKQQYTLLLYIVWKAYTIKSIAKQRCCKIFLCVLLLTCYSLVFGSHFRLQNKVLGLLQCYYVRLKCWNHYAMHISVNYFCVFRRLNIAQRCSSNKHVCQQRCYDVFSKVSLVRRFIRCLLLPLYRGHLESPMLPRIT